MNDDASNNFPTLWSQDSSCLAPSRQPNQHHMAMRPPITEQRPASEDIWKSFNTWTLSDWNGSLNGHGSVCWIHHCRPLCGLCNQQGAFPAQIMLLLCHHHSCVLERLLVSIMCGIYIPNVFESPKLKRINGTTCFSDCNNPKNGALILWSLGDQHSPRELPH